MHEETADRVLEQGYRSIVKLRNIASLVPVFYLSLVFTFFSTTLFPGWFAVNPRKAAGVKFLFLVLSLSIIPLRNVIYHLIYTRIVKIQAAKSSPEFVGLYLKASLLLLGCYELVAVLGVAVFVLFADLPSCLVFILLSLLYYFFLFPDRRAYRQTAPAGLRTEPS